MPNPDYSALVAAQREFFLTGATRPASWRKAQLQAVKAMFTENRNELYDALWRDLRRNAFDAEMIDVGLSAKNADYVSEHLDRWMEPERVHTPLIFEPGHALIRRDPLGVTLIIGAWNEPLVTVFAPVAAAFGAGNVVVVLCQEGARAPCCTRDEGGPFGAVL